MTSAYEHPPGPTEDLQALIDRAAAGDPSAVLELAKRQDLAGVGATPDSDAVAKAWSDKGEAAWEAKILEKIRGGDVKPRSRIPTGRSRRPRRPPAPTATRRPLRRRATTARTPTAARG